MSKGGGSLCHTLEPEDLSAVRLLSLLTYGMRRIIRSDIIERKEEFIRYEQRFG